MKQMTDEQYILRGLKSDLESATNKIINGIIKEIGMQNDEFGLTLYEVKEKLVEALKQVEQNEPLQKRYDDLKEKVNGEEDEE